MRLFALMRHIDTASIERSVCDGAEIALTWNSSDLYRQAFKPAVAVHAPQVL